MFSLHSLFSDWLYAMLADNSYRKQNIYRNSFCSVAVWSSASHVKLSAAEETQLQPYSMKLFF